MKLKQWSAGAFIALSTIFAAHTAKAESFPTKPVNIVVPYAAGGATDVIARLVAQGLSTTWNQPVIVNNKPGAGTVLGAESVARAPGDGYTLYMTTAAHTISASLYKKLPYDPMKDFAPITLTSVIPLVLITTPSLPVKTLQELVAYVKTHPGMPYGSPGNGSPQHLTGALFMEKTKIELTHVPYRGDAPMLTDLMSGQVEMAFITLSAALPHIKTGKVKPIALAHSKRIDAISNVPTFAEAGMPGFEAATWFGMLSPSSVPADLRNKIHKDISKVVADPQLTRKIVDMGGDVSRISPQEFQAFMQREAKNWAEAVRLSGAQVD